MCSGGRVQVCRFGSAAVPAEEGRSASPGDGAASVSGQEGVTPAECCVCAGCP